MIALIEPPCPKGEGGRPSYPLMAILRVHLMQNWFGYSDPTMEESLYETTILRQFAGLGPERMPDETTILNFLRLREKPDLAAGILGVINDYIGNRGLLLRQGTIVDATIIHAPSSTKNKESKRDPEMHQTRKGNQYFFGMKAHTVYETRGDSICGVPIRRIRLMQSADPAWPCGLYGCPD